MQVINRLKVAMLVAVINYGIGNIPAQIRMASQHIYVGSVYV